MQLISRTLYCLGCELRLIIPLHIELVYLWLRRITGPDTCWRHHTQELLLSCINIVAKIWLGILLKKVVLIAGSHDLDWRNIIYWPCLVLRLNSWFDICRWNYLPNVKRLLILLFWLIEILSRLILNVNIFLFIQLPLFKIFLRATTSITSRCNSFFSISDNMATPKVYFFKWFVYTFYSLVLRRKSLFRFLLNGSRNSSVYWQSLTSTLSLKSLVKVNVGRVHILIYFEVGRLQPRLWLLWCV